MHCGLCQTSLSCMYLLHEHKACTINGKTFEWKTFVFRVENGYLWENVHSSIACRVTLPIDKAIDYREALII